MQNMAWRRVDDVLFELVEGKAVLLDPGGRELITLNRVGSLVWNALDGRRDVGDLAADLVHELSGVTVATLEDDIAAFIQKLDRLDLVTADEPA